MNDDRVEVDELILGLADNKNDYADVTAEKLVRKCASSFQAYRSQQDRVHDTWLPDGTLEQVRQIIKKIQAHLHQQRE
jgi:hypothetical protein